MPLLVFHILAGSVALGSGTGAMIFRKGSRRHRASGNVFVASMFCLAASGAYIGFMKHQALNGLMGLLTFYLVATAWLTAKRAEGETGIIDIAALVMVLAVVSGLVFYGVEAASGETGSKDGYPAGAYFVFASWGLLFAAGDVRMLVRRGVHGKQRLVRHLSRMCFALFFATASFFLGQQQVFPAALRDTNLLLIPALLPLALLIFWLVRARRGHAPFPRAAVADRQP